jgi:hypothetical protein
MFLHCSGTLLAPVNSRFEGSIFDIVYQSAETTAPDPAESGKGSVRPLGTAPASVRKIQ